MMNNDKFQSEKLPNTLTYERIYLDRADENEEQSIKKEIAEMLRHVSHNELYDDMISLGCSDYLTTNYDYTFEKSIDLQPNIRGTEEIYSLRRYREYLGQQKSVRFWSLHGEIDSPKSIMLGLDHYCGAIAKLDSYIKGNYSTQKDGGLHQVSSMIKKLHEGKFCHTSWVDLFFSNDLHIVGLSLDFSETDLWWILNKRARLNKITPIKNKIYFHSTDEKSEKSDLLNKFGVLVQHYSVKDSYFNAYKNIFRTIGKIMK